jgi:hypothetical protein
MARSNPKLGEIQRLILLHTLYILDWLNYGMEHYSLTYEKAQELMEENGFEYSYGTLRNDKYVASTIPLSSRDDKLTWCHHYEVAPLAPDQQQYWLSYAAEHKLTTRELRAAIKGAEDLPWLRYTDVWNFSQCDDRFGLKDYPGRIPGQIAQNVLYYYTKPGDFIIDPMAGGGTTLDVCIKCETVKRGCLAFDIKPARLDSIKVDATQPWLTNKPADLIFIDPPYSSQLANSYGGLAKEPPEKFLAKVKAAAEEGLSELL